MSNQYSDFHNHIQEQPKSKNGCCFFLVALPVSFFVVMVLAFLIIFLNLRRNYQDWEKQFTSEVAQTEVLSMSDEAKMTELSDQVESKITAFSESTEIVDFIEFNVNEVEYLLGQKLSDSMPDGLEIDKIYIESGDGRWDIYFQPKSSTRKVFPWISLAVTKAEVESPRVKIDAVRVGEYDVSEFGVGFLVDDLNSGYTEALNLVNENEFTGRRFENIELEVNGLIVKGRLAGGG
ncbi:hypothetical protein GF357_01190 [Candidatus Dojkabacteria bacterium]|nr:hypothetical protein [Candidatus Dojkabacteria bacterium]